MATRSVLLPGAAGPPGSGLNVVIVYGGGYAREVPPCGWGGRYKNAVG